MYCTGLLCRRECGVFEQIRCARENSQKNDGLVHRIADFLMGSMMMVMGFWGLCVRWQLESVDGDGGLWNQREGD